jgi:hypothetical protein
VFKRIGFIAERFGAQVSATWLDECQASISQGVTDLDPDAPHAGPREQVEPPRQRAGRVMIPKAKILAYAKAFSGGLGVIHFRGVV